MGWNGGAWLGAGRRRPPPWNPPSWAGSAQAAGALPGPQADWPLGQRWGEPLGSPSGSDPGSDLGGLISRWRSHPPGSAIIPFPPDSAQAWRQPAQKRRGSPKEGIEGRVGSDTGSEGSATPGW